MVQYKTFVRQMRFYNYRFSLFKTLHKMVQDDLHFKSYVFQSNRSRENYNKILHRPLARAEITYGKFLFVAHSAE